jgi:hypothetical protein
VITNVQTHSLNVITEDAASAEGVVGLNTVVGTQAIISGIRLESGGTMDIQLLANFVRDVASIGISLRTVNGGTLNANVAFNRVLNAGDAGILFQSTLGDMSVLNFDGNTLIGVGGGGSVTLLEEPGTTMTIYGTPGTGNNIMDDSSIQRVWDVNNSVEGIFHIGPPVNADRLDNTDVP